MKTPDNLASKSVVSLRNLTDYELHQNTINLAHRERQTTLEVLHHLREVERRSLFAARAYSSLFEYVVSELKYSAGAAHRRIASMRLLKELPELEKKVESGVLNLSALSQAQSFFRHEKSSVAEKREVIKELENKSTREVERELANRSTNPTFLYQEKVRPVSAEFSELKILIDQNLLKHIEKLRGLLAHSKPGASIKELLEYAVELTVEGLTPKAPKHSALRPKNVAAKTDQTENIIQSAPSKSTSVDSRKILLPAVEVETQIGQEIVKVEAHLGHKIVNGGAKKGQTTGKKASRYIPVEIRRKIFSRDNGRCGYIDPSTQRCCGSEFGLELDHIRPYSIGGESSVENLRLRCQAHNQLEAMRVFGPVKMAQHLSRLR